MSFLRQLVDELNKVRENPKSYIEKLEKYKGYFDKNNLVVPGLGYAIQTQEGAAAYDECIKFLRTADKGPHLIPSKGLTAITDELLKGFLKDNKMAAVDIKSLISKYGSYTGSFNRILQCGGETPEQVVIHLLVCDGDKNRRQRDVILKTSLKRMGVSSAEHELYVRATLIAFTETFENKNHSDDVENFGGPKFEAPKLIETKPPVKKEEKWQELHKKNEPPPKKNEPPPKKYEPPQKKEEKSQESPKKYEPPPKKYAPPKKEEKSQEPPKKYEPPLKKYEPPQKKEEKSKEPPKKYEPPPKKYEPPQKKEEKSKEPPKKYEPPPKK